MHDGPHVEARGTTRLSIAWAAVATRYRPTPVMPAEISQLWRILCIRRMELDRWELVPSREPPLAFEGRLRLFCEIAARNIDRARRRLPPSALA